MFLYSSLDLDLEWIENENETQEIEETEETEETEEIEEVEENEETGVLLCELGVGWLVACFWG